MLNAAAALNLKTLAPFRLLIVSNHHLAIVNSNGQTLQTQSQPRPQTPMMLTSSGLGDHLVQPPRRALFNAWFPPQKNPRSPDTSGSLNTSNTPDTWPDQQDRFHQHHWPDRPHLSVLMQRPDARTVCRTVIEVADHRVQLHHENISDTPTSHANHQTQTQNHDKPCRLTLPRTTTHTHPHTTVASPA